MFFNTAVSVHDNSAFLASHELLRGKSNEKKDGNLLKETNQDGDQLFLDPNRALDKIAKYALYKL